MTAKSHAGIYARVPPGFSTQITELPAEFYMQIGLVASGGARLELFLGLLVNNLGFKIENDLPGPWPYKVDARVRWLETAFDLHQLSNFRARPADVLARVRAVNSIRNEIVHSAILAYGPDHSVFVARVKTDRKGKRLELQEGTSYNLVGLRQAALAIEHCNHALLTLVRDVREVTIEPDPLLSP